jgi:hypothetical protein
MGIPREPGGTLFGDLLPLVRRRKIEISNVKTMKRVFIFPSLVSSVCVHRRSEREQ